MQSCANINIAFQQIWPLFLDPLRPSSRCCYVDSRYFVVVFSPLLSPMMEAVEGIPGGRQGWQRHADELESQAACSQTLDRGLRPGPESFWETKNGSEIPAQDNILLRHGEYRENNVNTKRTPLKTHIDV